VWGVGRRQGRPVEVGREQAVTGEVGGQLKSI
jgi:hypothetical protein